MIDWFFPRNIIISMCYLYVLEPPNQPLQPDKLVHIF